MPWLNEEVAKRLDSKLDWIKLQPRSWVDWEPAWGGGSAGVAARYPEARHGLVGWQAQHAAPTAGAAPSTGWQGLKHSLLQWWTGESGSQQWRPDQLDVAPWEIGRAHV